MSLEKSIEARILKYLYSLERRGELEKAYKREIARNIGVSERATYTYIQTLINKGYIELSREQGIQRFYKLTDVGRALAWALLNPDELATLSGKEEIAKLGGGIEDHANTYKMGRHVSEELETFIPLAEAMGFRVDEIKKIKETKEIIERKIKRGEKISAKQRERNFI